MSKYMKHISAKSCIIEIYCAYVFLYKSLYMSHIYFMFIGVVLTKSFYFKTLLEYFRFPNILYYNC